MPEKGEPQFISEEVAVEREGPMGYPLAFTWQGKEYPVQEVEKYWRHIDRRSAWWMRHHRDHYIVRTPEGERYHLYYHRGFGRRHWVLYRKLGDEE
jgi:hypothetical protein